MSNKCVDSTYLLSFEKLGQVKLQILIAWIVCLNIQKKGYGFILYKTTLDDANVDGKLLKIEGIRDRGYVQIGEVKILFVYAYFYKMDFFEMKQIEMKNSVPSVLCIEYCLESFTSIWKTTRIVIST